MTLVSELARLAALFWERPAALGAVLSWPTFSITSYRLVGSLRRQGVLPRTVIDVGANVGQFACAALRLLTPERLHAFEPLPQSLGALRRHIGATPGVVIHPVALGAAAGSLPLHVNAHSYSSSLLPLGAAHRNAFPSSIQVEDIQVPVCTLDAELAGLALPEPVLLKLDVQGYERWVLEGASRTLEQTEWLILELSFRPMYDGEPSFLDLVNEMSRRRFRFERPVGWLTAPGTDEILQCDALLRRER